MSATMLQRVPSLERQGHPAVPQSFREHVRLTCSLNQSSKIILLSVILFEAASVGHCRVCSTVMGEGGVSFHRYPSGRLLQLTLRNLTASMNSSFLPPP